MRQRMHDTGVAAAVAAVRPPRVDDGFHLRRPRLPLLPIAFRVKLLQCCLRAVGVAFPKQFQSLLGEVGYQKLIVVLVDICFPHTHSSSLSGGFRLCCCLANGLTTQAGG